MSQVKFLKKETNGDISQSIETSDSLQILSLGIGAAAPALGLDVKGSGTGRVLISENATNAAFGAISLNGSLAGVNYNFTSSASDTNLYINRPTGQKIWFQETGTGVQLVLDTGGFVGVGTSTPATGLNIVGASYPGSIVRAQNTSAAANVTGGFEIFNDIPNSGTLYLYSSTSTGAAGTSTKANDLTLSGDAGDINLRTQSAAHSINFHTNPGSGLLQRMTILDSGNVGIGTLAPAQKFEVFGGNIVETFNTNAATYIQINNTDAGATAQSIFSAINGAGNFCNVGVTGSGYTPIVTWDRQNVAYINTQSPAGISIASRNAAGIITFHSGGNAEQMRITAAGNIGIGTAAPDPDILFVRRDQNASTRAIVLNAHTGTSAEADVQASNGSYYGHVSMNGTSFSAPGTVFVANQATYYTQGPGGLAVISSDASAPMIFATGGYATANERMRILATGFVGIGTSTPTAKLHTQGGSFATGENVLLGTGTFPNPGGSSTERAFHFISTSSGSGNSSQYNVTSHLQAGYTGDQYTISQNILNEAAGTAVMTALGNAANYGLFDQARGTTSGTNVGHLAVARESSSLNLAGAFRANDPGNSPTNQVGVYSVAGLGSVANSGGYFALHTTIGFIPAWVNAALVADNGNVAAPIQIWRDNGTEVMRVADGGDVGIGVTPIYRLHVHAGSTGSVAGALIQGDDQGPTVGSLSTAANHYALEVVNSATSTGSGAVDVFVVMSNGNVNVGNPTASASPPTSLFSVGATSQFQVNSTGNIVKINNVTTSFPATQGAADTSLENDGAGNLSWVGKSYSEIYFDNVGSPATITVATANSYYNLAASTVTVGVQDANGNAAGSVSGNSIVVGTDGAGDYMVVGSVSGDGPTNAFITFVITINGTVQGKTRSSSKVGVFSTPTNWNMSGILTLVATDAVAIYVTSDTNGDVIDIFNLNLSIHRISK